MEKLRIIVGGYIGLYPTGGVTWDYIQYPLGLHLLGHDVYYIEDTVQYPKYQREGKRWDDASDSVAYLQQTMNYFGLGSKWAYRDVASGKCFGLPLEKVLDICKTADVFINISASTFLRDEYMGIPRRVLIDSDPMFTQIDYHYQQMAGENSRYKMKFLLENHNYLFSFGENINQPGNIIPQFEFTWHTTRQPVCLPYWNNGNVAARKNVFSTVMNWSVTGELQYNGTWWGQKDKEFEKFMSIPRQFPHVDFELMVANLPEKEQKRMGEAGWKLVNPLTAITNACAYQQFIQQSAAEFSVAKHTYVQSASGWFSCRSACYLAAGRPVITQDTGWSAHLPCGNGLFAFTDMASAAEAIGQVTANYQAHCRSAKTIARQYFDSNMILTELLDKIQ